MKRKKSEGNQILCKGKRIDKSSKCTECIYLVSCESYLSGPCDKFLDEEKAEAKICLTCYREKCNPGVCKRHKEKLKEILEGFVNDRL